MSTHSRASTLPPLEPPYDRVTRYIDPHTGLVTAKLVPGQLFVGGSRDCITTVVGSCLTVCIHDPRARRWHAAVSASLSPVWHSSGA